MSEEEENGENSHQQTLITGYGWREPEEEEEEEEEDGVFERVHAYISENLKNKTRDYDVIDVSRRDLLEFGAGVGVSRLINPVIQDLRTPGFEDTWPSKLENWAKNTGDKEIQKVYRNSNMKWSVFSRKSDAIIKNKPNEGDRIRACSVFFRADYNKFYENIVNVSENQDVTVEVYMSNPVVPQNMTEPPLQNHEDSEIKKYRQKISDENWARYHNKNGKKPPHPNHIVLNRIRANFNIIRALQAAIFTSAHHDGIHYYPINGPMSFRGRIIGDHHAAFLEMEKQVIGTTKQTAGHITTDIDLISYLNDEIDNIANTNKELTPELLAAYQDQVADRIRHQTDELSDIKYTIGNDIKNHLDDILNYDIDLTDVNTTYEDWKEFDEKSRNKIDYLTKSFKKKHPFDIKKY